jgi:hypothetical protein
MAMIETGKVHREFKKQSLIFGIIVSMIALLICCLGVWLVYLKSAGQTHFKLFGQDFKSDNARIAAIFIGAVVLTFTLWRTFKSLDNITGSYRKVTSKIWDSHRNADSIER